MCGTATCRLAVCNRNYTKRNSANSATFKRELNAGGLRRSDRDISFEVSYTKRLVILCMVLSLVAVVTVGCEKKSTTERKEAVTTPDGSTTTTGTHKVESSGDNAPTNTTGEKRN